MKWLCTVYSSRDGEVFPVDDSFRWGDGDGDDCDAETAERRAQNICRRMDERIPAAAPHHATLYRAERTREVTA